MSIAPAIPASYTVTVNPGVISAGGTALDLIGLGLTASTRVPIGTVRSFATAADVATFFGSGTAEANFAAVYFAANDNKTKTPDALLFAQYPTAAVPAYLRGGNISGLTLAQLQALTGVLTLTVDGQAFTSGTINLSSATSFSSAAALIQTGLAAADAVVTGSIAATTLTVTAVTSGTLAVGQAITGSGITAGTTITALGTGTGGTGTYTVSISQTASSTTITAGRVTCTYDSVSGAFIITGGQPGATGSITFATGTLSASLLLTAATGAVISQGAAVAVPGTAMSAIAALTQGWASFTTVGFEPSTADTILFAAWTSLQNKRYAYIAWDTDVTVTQANPTASAGYAIIAAGYSGTVLAYEPTDLLHEAFVMGVGAAIDFDRTNGRRNFKFTSQDGLAPAVTNQTIAAQLTANGYNYYGANANATNQWNFFAEGSVTGEFLWLDSYFNEIWLTSQMQTALMTLLTSSPSIPYNPAGYGLIEAALLDPILAGVNFGAIRENVPLSALQVAEVNADAGRAIDGVLSSRGWYILIQPATAQVRAARGSPPVSVFYNDGQSVNRINVASIQIQ